MNATTRVLSLAMGLAVLLIPLRNIVQAQSTLDCGLCHSDNKALWLTSKHAATQQDVAGELALNWAGQTPDSVITGSQAENCVACHGPISVTVGGGMTETQVMGHFFSTTNGVYTDSTQPTDVAHWPHDNCVTCHDVPTNHPATLPSLSIFNSTTVQYDSVRRSSELCGRCHGTIRFADTDHRIYDAWKLSRHGQGGQGDVAGELASSWAGSTPAQVVSEENCIACHAPGSVRMSGGITEATALGHFFTTSGGVFTAQTAGTDTMHWPELGCDGCHNPHKPDTLSYFNSTTRTYQAMGNSSQLCGQCHGNLRFPGTDHLTYNIETGTGGIGVPTIMTMPGTKCTDCHMHTSDVEGSNSLMYKGHRWSAFIHEPDGSVSASCTACHAGMNADSARVVVDTWESGFGNLDSTADFRVALAESLMQGVTDTTKLRYLAEAEHNLGYAEGDESGGFHNHNFGIALLNDAIAKADVLTGVKSVQGTGVPATFELMQNHPNPFNPSTVIRYSLPTEARVQLKVYDILGREIAVLVDGIQQAGSRSVEWRPEGSGVASGVYFYRLEATGTSGLATKFSQMRKMLLLK